MNQVRGKVKARTSTPKYGRWFRFYNDSINDPKVQLLAPDMFKHWINMLCIASKNDGVIPQDGLAFMLHAAACQVETAIQELIRVGLIEYATVRGDTCLTPHGWFSRQFRWDATDPTNSERQKRHRNSSVTAKKRSRNGRVTVGVTEIPSESESVSESESPRTTVVAIQDRELDSGLDSDSTEVCK